MADKIEEVIGDLEDAEEDKTSEKNEELPDEEDFGEEEKKVDKSEIAQKIKYREKLNKERAEKEALKAELETYEQKEKKEHETAEEKKAREYLEKLVDDVLEQRNKKAEAEEAKIIADFEEACDAVLEENTDITEKELLDVCEKYSVQPQAAAKIIADVKSGKKEKPQMPISRRASVAVKTPKFDTTGKSLYDVGKFIKDKFAKEG